MSERENMGRESEMSGAPQLWQRDSGGANVYLDHAATTPLLPEVRVVVERALAEGFGNPSSLHGPGRASRRLVEEARERVAAAIGAAPADVVFTASGSEANNQALRGVVGALPRELPIHLILSDIEHACIRNTAEDLEQVAPNVTVTRLAPDEDGCIDSEAVAEAIRPETRLVSVMTVNNETGACQPINEISQVCREAGIPFHTDACQAPGRSNISTLAQQADMITLSAHKCYGPKGAAALIIQGNTPMRSLVTGGAQERERRAGTENVAAIAGFGVALAEAAENWSIWRGHAEDCETALFAALTELRVELKPTLADDEHRTRGIWNGAIGRLAADELLIGLDLEGIAISTGSACSSGSIEPSETLQAMGLPQQDILQRIRISAGLGTDPAAMPRVATAIKAIADRKDLHGC